MTRSDGPARRIRVLRRAFCLLVIAVASCSESVPTIDLDTTNPARPVIVVTGLSRRDLARLSNANLSAEEWNAVLRVTVRSSASTASDVPAMAGRYSVEGSLRFWPAFPLDPGREYEVRFDPSAIGRAGLAGRRATTAVISVPGVARAPSTFVDAVYPSGDLVPENQLRIYLHFSAPMGQQGGFDHIAFLDDSGRDVPGVIVPLDTELWNTERTEYTVKLDPGRVKRGTLPNRQSGRPFRAGEGITIVVRTDWPDARGVTLTSEFRHRYRVAAPDKHALSTAEWHVTPPAAGSRDPLMVTFPKPLDYDLLQRSLSVGRGNSTMPGDARVSAAETRWEFVPRSEWQRGPYVLTVQPILEDLAGNRIGRAFDVMSRGHAVPAESGVPVSVPFIVR